MPRPTRLPAHLSGVPLTPDEARTAGLSPKVLRGSRFRHEGRGLYAPHDWDPDLGQRCQALLSVLPPTSAFTHGTAAQLWGMPLPWNSTREVHVATPDDIEPPDRRGIVSHKMRLPEDHRMALGSLPVTTPARTLLDLAPGLRLHELVAAGDHAFRHLGLNREQVRLMRRWAKGRRGVRRLEQAERLFDARAESPQESVVRVWCHRSGLPRLVPNAEIFDGEAFVARVDLYSEVFRIAIEYEGAYHRTREQYARDIGRRARLAALGVEVVQIEASMMRSPHDVVAHVAQALHRRGWRGETKAEDLNRLLRMTSSRRRRPLPSR